jgi:hypothetical protein
VRHYALHGYELSADLDLPLPALPSPTGAPRLVARTGAARTVPTEPPDGFCLAQLDDEAHHVYYSFVRHGDGTHTLRFNGTLDVLGDESLSQVTAVLDPAADPGVVPILLTGAVMATRMILDDQLVLHASAVSLGSRAVAFVGSSGMGKSTMATLLCTAGGSLMTDDVARVTQGSDGPCVWAGSTETRLRRQAWSIADALPGASTRLTADGRTALRPQHETTGARPLGLLVVPRPDRAADRVEARTVRPSDALTLLAAFPRVVGWRDMARARTQFLLLADLAERVRVVNLTVPWGPPFAPDLGMQLRDAVEPLLP